MADGLFDTSAGHEGVLVGSVLLSPQASSTSCLAPISLIFPLSGEKLTVARQKPWSVILVLAMTAAQFKSYAAVVIGDPSSGSCSTLTLTTATSGTDAIGTAWQSAVTSTGGTRHCTWDTEGNSQQLLMDGTNAYIYADGTAPAEQVKSSIGGRSRLDADLYAYMVECLVRSLI